MKVKDIAILILIVWVLILATKWTFIGSKYFDKGVELSDTTIVKSYDTTIYSIVNTTKIIPSSRTQTKTIFKDVDTANILSEYHQTLTYQREYRDSNVWAKIRDTLYQNKLIGQGFEYKVLKPSITKTITKTELMKYQLFLTSNISSDGDIKIGGDFIKGRVKLGGSINPINNNWQVGLGYRILKK